MRFQMEKLTENTVGDDNVLVYKSADISDADLLIRIYNSVFYDDNLVLFLSKKLERQDGNQSYIFPSAWNSSNRSLTR